MDCVLHFVPALRFLWNQITCRLYKSPLDELNYRPMSPMCICMHVKRSCTNVDSVEDHVVHVQVWWIIKARIYSVFINCWIQCGRRILRKQYFIIKHNLFVLMGNLFHLITKKTMFLYCRLVLSNLLSFPVFLFKWNGFISFHY